MVIESLVPVSHVLLIIPLIGKLYAWVIIARLVIHSPKIFLKLERRPCSQRELLVLLL